ncbi:hypothetical protein FPCIR_12948 [Fusarium pseudocircinatum]|uniref:Uncharacterized protein n=1 Tax=Fusarium pseudocircinatum TaxID=56676 RepID=A0A8H5KME5_9HYPO|nr:hypothetical protein FPCIR_12948 [Fusarium pseudocircinatum]
MILNVNQKSTDTYIRTLDSARGVEDGVEMNLDEIATKDYCLKFSEILSILYAGLNFRSCGSLEAAKALLNNGTHYTDKDGYHQSLPDFISVMGGFSSVIGPIVESEVSDKLPGKPRIHLRLELAIDKYVYNSNPDDRLRLWSNVSGLLRSCTDGEKDLICKEVTAQLINSMQKISTGDRTYLIMTPARDMISMDKDGYGIFGKTGGSAMTPDQFDRSVIIESRGQGSGGSLVPTRLVWAFAEHTERVHAVFPSKPLYDFVLK